MTASRRVRSVLRDPDTHERRTTMHTSRTTRLIVTCAGVPASFATAASAHSGPIAGPQTQPGDPLDPRTYAPESKPFLTVNATGVQKYACQANGTWLFTDPVADLYKP